MGPGCEQIYLAQKPGILLSPYTISSRMLSSLNLNKHNSVTSLVSYSLCMNVLSPPQQVSPGARPHPLFALSSGQVQSQTQTRHCVFTY